MAVCIYTCTCRDLLEDLLYLCYHESSLAESRTPSPAVTSCLKAHRNNVSPSSSSVFTAACTIIQCHQSDVSGCELDLKSTVHTAEILRSFLFCTSLERIKLLDRTSDHSLTAGDCMELTKVVQNNTHCLTEFTAHITIVPVEVYVHLEKCPLKRLLLCAMCEFYPLPGSKPGLPPTSAEVIAAASHLTALFQTVLPNLHQLQQLILEAIWLDDTALKQLALAVAAKPDLFCLQLYVSHLTPGSLSALSALVSSLPKLGVLLVLPHELGEYTVGQDDIDTFHHDTRNHCGFSFLFPRRKEGEIVYEREKCGRQDS